MWTYFHPSKSMPSWSNTTANGTQSQKNNPHIQHSYTCATQSDEKKWIKREKHIRNTKIQRKKNTKTDIKLLHMIKTCHWFSLQGGWTTGTTPCAAKKNVSQKQNSKTKIYADVCVDLHVAQNRHAPEGISSSEKGQNGTLRTDFCKNLGPLKTVRSGGKMRFEKNRHPRMEPKTDHVTKCCEQCLSNGCEKRG